MSHIKHDRHKRAPQDNRPPVRQQHLFEGVAYLPNEVLDQHVPLEAKLGEISIDSNGNFSPHADRPEDI